VCENSQSLLSGLFEMDADLKEEIINLESTEETTVHQLASRIPADRGRYHLFRFGHTNEGDYLESIGLSRLHSNKKKYSPDT